MALLNDFLVGADPEFVFMTPPHIVNGSTIRHTNIVAPPLWGWDHGGFVVEPHPEPDFSVRKVVQNIKKCLDGLAFRYSDFRWRGGAFVEGSPASRRLVGLGGHVHLDFQDPTARQIRAFDAVNQTLTRLDILPAIECATRTERTNYGHLGDIRQEHGHMEYRSLCSWLFSRKTSMLAMTAIKLAAVDPASIQASFTSMTGFRNWFELYSDRDDDARWIIEKEYFTTNMEARPDRDIKTVWKVNPDLGKTLWTPRPRTAAAVDRRAILDAPVFDDNEDDD